MDLSAVEWLLLAFAALLVGSSKTAISGLMGVTVVIFATILPARESTGALLPLLLVGDVVAVLMYRREVEWRLLLRVLPVVAIGVLVGVVFVSRVDDAMMARAIGVILLVLLAFQLFGQRLVSAPTDSARDPATIGYGLLSGFTTMVANQGGPSMSLYLLRSGLARNVFIGTLAWFFLVVNVFKVPFAAGLGLISAQSLQMDLVLAPAVVIGGFLGRAAIVHVPQKLFEQIVLAVVAVSAVALIVSPSL